jgi:hypothetical protein
MFFSSLLQQAIFALGALLLPVELLLDTTAAGAGHALSSWHFSFVYSRQTATSSPPACVLQLEVLSH